MKKLIIVRRAAQCIFFALFGYILWSTTYPLKGALPPRTFFLLDPLLVGVTSIAERLVLPGMILSGTLILLTAVFGRFFCGWVCPLGAMLDLTASLKRKRRAFSDLCNSRIRRIKYCVLSIIGVAAIFGIQCAWWLDPTVIAARFISLNAIPLATYLFQSLFVFVLRDLHIRGMVEDLYRALKPNILGVKAILFPHSLTVCLFFVAIASLTFIVSRLWCRALCPLGALYGCVSRWAFLKRTVTICTQCGACKSACRMGAITDDMRYVKSECILCMDCVYDCPQHATRFVFRQKKPVQRDRIQDRSGISRGQFLALAASSVALCGFSGEGKVTGSSTARKMTNIIRPPGALKEDHFIERCVRCGNCMKVCITNGLQPVFFQGGVEALWTPQLVPEIGYCEHQCTLCGETCPTGAIPALPLEKKKKTRLGLACIDHDLCIPWKRHTQCIVCQEHCPVSEKAIKLVREDVGGAVILKPVIDETLCIGCGICQNKCPVRPERAVKVLGEYADRA